MNWDDRKQVCREIEAELSRVEKICAQARPVNFYIGGKLDDAQRRYNNIHHQAETLLATTHRFTDRELTRLAADREIFSSQSTASDIFNDIIGSSYVQDDGLGEKPPKSDFAIQKQQEKRYSRLIEEGKLYETYLRSKPEFTATKTSYSSMADSFIDFDLLNAIEGGSCAEIGLEYTPMAKNAEEECLMQLKESRASTLARLAEIRPKHYDIADKVEKCEHPDILESHKNVAEKLRVFFELSAFCNVVCKAAEKLDSDASTSIESHFDERSFFHSHLEEYKRIPALKPIK